MVSVPFEDGGFANAADAFHRYMAIGPRSGLALAWIALSRLRAGQGDDQEALRAGPRGSTVGDARDHAIDALANGWNLDASLWGRELCTPAFFSGQHALLAGDVTTARDRFTAAVESGEDQQEARSARAELLRLESS